MPTPACTACQGNRYLLDRTGDLCAARVCACNQSCSACGGTGRTLVEKDGYTFAAPCACRSVFQRVTRFNQARLPARCGLSFDDFLPQNDEQRRAREIAQMAAFRYRPDQPSKGFILSGPVGTGKTHLLCAALRHLTLELGVPARYVEISFLFAQIRAGFSQGRSGLDVIQPLVDADVLAIDEIGKGKGSPFELDTLDELVSKRYQAGRTTLFATNFSLAAERPRRAGYADPAEAATERLGDQLLRERIGERIYSRLHEMCHAVQFPPATADYRRREGALAGPKPR